jgi:hypothetical protein
MKIARSALFLFVPAIAGFTGVVAVACSNSSSTGPSAGEDSGTPHAMDSGSAPDTSAADTGTGSTGDSSTTLPTDAGPQDTGSSGNEDAAEAAASPSCGPAPDRYTLLGDAGAQLADAGLGLVEDNTTGLVWMSDSVGGEQTQEQTQTLAASYCSGIGMRLPTETEAQGIAAANYASCAFGQWSTWTSTATPGTPGDAQTVDFLGDVYPQLADNFPNAVLCVRGGSGDN